jgi:hypothetical protein
LKVRVLETVLRRSIEPERVDSRFEPVQKRLVGGSPDLDVLALLPGRKALVRLPCARPADLFADLLLFRNDP